MSYFLQNGDVFSPTPGKEAVLETLPVGNYIVIETMQGLMFKKVENFQEPGRMYGNINARAQRILDTFLDRPRATGVLLEGEKGSGKSQLARNVSLLGYKMDIPTILVNAPFAGDAFNNLIASVEQPAIVIFDEFEKVYNEDRGRQEQVLTLLDGVVTTRKLFIMTVNNKYRVNEHMHNRPGRIYYSIEFEGLETEFVREYCDDNLNDKDEIDNVLKVSAMFKAFNFDMLKALVEEMNRYKESAFDVLEILNAKPFTSTGSTTYQLTIVAPNGSVSGVTEQDELPMTSRGGRVSVYGTFETPIPKKTKDRDILDALMGDEPDDENENGLVYNRHFILKSEDLKKLDVEKGRYEFEADGFVFSYIKKEPTFYSMRDL